MNQVRANSKKKLSSEQMKIKKELTQKQSAIKIEVFDRVREKLLEYRKTNDYLVYLENQIKNIMSEYSDVDITIYIDIAKKIVINTTNKKLNDEFENFSKTDVLS